MAIWNRGSTPPAKPAATEAKAGNATQTDGAVAFHNWTGDKEGWYHDNSFVRNDYLFNAQPNAPFGIRYNKIEAQGQIFEFQGKEGYYYQVNTRNNHIDRVGRPSSIFTVVYFKDRVSADKLESLKETLMNVPTAIDKENPERLRIVRHGDKFTIDAQYRDGVDTITPAQAWENYQTGKIWDIRQYPDRADWKAAQAGAGLQEAAGSTQVDVTEPVGLSKEKEQSWQATVPPPRATELSHEEQVQGPTPLEAAIMQGLRKAGVQEELIAGATTSVSEAITPFVRQRS